MSFTIRCFIYIFYYFILLIKVTYDTSCYVEDTTPKLVVSDVCSVLSSTDEKDKLAKSLLKAIGLPDACPIQPVIIYLKNYF